MKKRFEIANFDIDEPSVLIDNDTYQVILTLRDYCYDEINFLENLLNEQNEEIKELEKEIVMWKSKAEHMFNACKKQSAKDLKKIYDCVEEIDQLKRSQNSKAIEVLEDIIKTCNLAKEFCGAKATALDITSATAYNQCINDMIGIIKDQLAELRGKEND